MNTPTRILSILLAGFLVLGPGAFANSTPCGNNNNGGTGGNGGDNTNTPNPEQGDPMIPYTGNEFKTIDDLQLWGAIGGYPMVFSRHSNSRVVPGANSFGEAHYWRHSFQWDLTKLHANSSGQAQVRIVYPTGSTFTYTETAPNQWTNRGTSADMLWKEDGQFVLQTQDSYRYYFESFLTGTSKEYFLMTRVQDPHGNSFTLAYDSARRFTSVREPGGRFIRAIYSTLSGSRLNATNLFTMAAPPEPNSWTIIPVNNPSTFNYIRVVQADGSYGNISEVLVYEYGTGNLLQGEIISSDTMTQAAKAFDGDPSTAFQSASASGGFVGIKLPAAKRIGWIRVLIAPGTEALHKPKKFGHTALRVEGSKIAPISTTAITRVETSDGRAVDYQYTNVVDPSLPFSFPALTSVVYGDGTRAEYRYAQVFPGTRPLVTEWDDVRYALRQGRYRTNYQNNLTGAVLGAVTSQVNLETGGEILRIGLKDGNLHRPMVTFANSGNVVQYYGTNKQGAYAITKEKDRNGNTTSYTFHPDTGFMATKTDPLGRVTSYTWSPTGQMATQTHPDGSTESWTYNALGSETSHTDTLGRTTTTTRDGLNRITRMDFPDGTHEAFTYNTFGQILTHRLRNGGTESRTYDSRGLLVTITDPLGHSTHFTYDSADRPVTVTDALGRVTRTDYNERGLVTKITHPDGTFRAFTYTKYGDVATETNELGHTWTFTYDIFRRVVTQTDPLGRTWTRTYHPDSYEAAPLAVTSPSGKTTTFTYDKEWNLLTTSVAGATSTLTYDKAYNPLSFTDPMGSRWLFSYDARNRRITETDPLNNVTRRTYDAEGNVLTEIRPDGGVTTNTYDPMDRLIETTDPKSQTTRLTYDASGNVLTLTDPKNHVYSWTYDLAMRKTAAIYPGGSRELFNYDAVGNPIGYTTRAGQVRTSVFDSRNREVETNWSDPATPDIVRTFDAAGRLTTEDNGFVSLTFAYDAANQLTSESSTTTGQPTRTVTYAYNADGQRTSTTYPGGSVVTTTHNARYLPSTIGLDGDILATYEYNPSGQPTAKHLENGMSTHFLYDNARRLTGIEHRKGFDMVLALSYTPRQRGQPPQ
ncbi:MAG: hypothetical protein Fur0032_02490 [Terrimicrobiaceae bacterium]